MSEMVSQERFSNSHHGESTSFSSLKGQPRSNCQFTGSLYLSIYLSQSSGTHSFESQFRYLSYLLLFSNWGIILSYHCHRQSIFNVFIIRKLDINHPEIWHLSRIRLNFRIFLLFSFSCPNWDWHSFPKFVNLVLKSWFIMFSCFYFVLFHFQFSCQ